MKLLCDELTEKMAKKLEEIVKSDNFSWRSTKERKKSSNFVGINACDNVIRNVQYAIHQNKDLHDIDNPITNILFNQGHLAKAMKELFQELTKID